MSARVLAAIAACAALAAGAAGCGEKKDVLRPATAERFDLLLDYFPNADHAGIYAAKAEGDFADVGLDVRIHQPADPAAPLKQVAAGRTDLAVSYEPEVLRARDKGLPVVSVGALVRRPLTAIISLPKARIRGAADLKGKIVGTAGIDYQSAYLRTILDAAGVRPSTVKQRDLGFSLTPALLTGRVDAVLGAFWNYEGVELKLRGKDPRILRIEQLGVPTYDELVLVANEDDVRDHPDRLRAFIGALGRGTRSLARHPDAALRGLLRDNRDLDPRVQRASLRVTLPLFLPARGKPYGYQDPGEWRRFGEWMASNDLLKTAPAPGAFTNELLPGRGP